LGQIKNELPQHESFFIAHQIREKKIYENTRKKGQQYIDKLLKGASICMQQKSKQYIFLRIYRYIDVCICVCSDAITQRGRISIDK
jgi:hypothetical protein